MKRSMIRLEVSTLYCNWMFGRSHFAVRKVNGVSVESVTALSAVLSVRIIVQEGGEMLVKEVCWRSFSI